MALDPDRRRLDYVCVPLSVLSGFGAVLAVPLLWWRRDRLAVVATIAALAQGLTFIQSGRGGGVPDPGELLVGVPAIPFVILAVAVARTLPVRDAVASFGFLGVATLLAGAVVQGQGGDRYLMAGLFTFTFVTVTGLAAGRRLAIPILVWMLFLMVTTFRIAPAPDVAWSTHARCIGGSVPCEVPAWPPEWSVSWSPVHE